MIDASFGSWERFRGLFLQTARTQFGSGWLWLTWENERLRLTCTTNAENPLHTGQVPLLALDLWEHAYYLDYRNRRNDYVAAYLDHLANWEFASANLAAAHGSGKGIVQFFKLPFSKFKLLVLSFFFKME